MYRTTAIECSWTVHEQYQFVYLIANEFRHQGHLFAKKRYVCEQFMNDHKLFMSNCHSKFVSVKSKIVPIYIFQRLCRTTQCDFSNTFKACLMLCKEQCQHRHCKRWSVLRRHLISGSTQHAIFPYLIVAKYVVALYHWRRNKLY